MSDQELADGREDVSGTSGVALVLTSTGWEARTADGTWRWGIKDADREGWVAVDGATGKPAEGVTDLLDALAAGNDSIEADHPNLSHLPGRLTGEPFIEPLPYGKWGLVNPLLDNLDPRGVKHREVSDDVRYFLREGNCDETGEREGCTWEETAEKLGIDRSTVARHALWLRDRGLLD
jgi:hypothetical protein